MGHGDRRRALATHRVGRPAPSSARSYASSSAGSTTEGVNSRARATPGPLSASPVGQGVAQGGRERRRKVSRGERDDGPGAAEDFRQCATVRGHHGQAARPSPPARECRSLPRGWAGRGRRIPGRPPPAPRHPVRPGTPCGAPHRAAGPARVPLPGARRPTRTSVAWASDGWAKASISAVRFL